MNASSAPSLSLDQVRQLADDVRRQIGTVLVGQEDRVTLMLAALLADGHVLIEGVPGVAKTLTARLLAKTLDVAFARIQFTPDLMPADILGTSVFDPRSTQFSFRRGPIFSNLVLIDEINRAPAKTQSALFEVMEERQVTADGETHPLGPPFMVVATQNPIEHEGTYRLPEAQLDRFLFKIEVGYPTLDEETRILETLSSTMATHRVDDVQPVFNAHALAQSREAVRGVHVEAQLLRYAATLVHTTRNHPMLYLGASPRASLSVVASARALAALAGRDFVTPEDVQEVAFPVLRHRIQLTPEQEMEGVRPDEAIRNVIDRVEVPR